jgi:hypothetical protein
MAEPASAEHGRSEPELAWGWCEREVSDELPGLSLLYAHSHVAHTFRDSPPVLKQRLAALSNRWSGAHAVSLRQRPVPAAYRVFFRHIGLDPDVVRTPVEEAMFARMMQGGFHSNHLLADALLITLVDTGVPVWALHAATVEGSLGVRASREGEQFGGPPSRAPNGSPTDPLAEERADLPARGRSRPAGASLLPAGRLVVADSHCAVAVLFGAIAPGHAAGAGADEVVLFTLQVPGVPSLHVEEALWMCRAMLEGPR